MPPSSLTSGPGLASPTSGPGLEICLGASLDDSIQQSGSFHLELSQRRPMSRDELPMGWAILAHKANTAGASQKPQVAVMQMEYVSGEKLACSCVWPRSHGLYHPVPPLVT